MGSKWFNNPAWFGVNAVNLTLAARLLANPAVIITNWEVIPTYPGSFNAILTGVGDYAFHPVIPLAKLAPRFPWGYAVEPKLPSVNTSPP